MVRGLFLLIRVFWYQRDRAFGRFGPFFLMVRQRIIDGCPSLLDREIVLT